MWMHLVVWSLVMVLFAGLQSCRIGSDITQPADGVKEFVDESGVTTSASLVVSDIFINASREKILGNFSRSVELLKEGVKRDPKHHPSYFQLADVHHIVGEYYEALEYIQMAINLEKDNIWYHALHGDLLLKTGNYDEAARVYDIMVSMQPGHQMWHEARAHSLAMAGDSKVAATAYRNILKQFGYDEEVFLKMLDLYERDKRHRKVEQSLQWLIAEYPYESRYLSALAAFYYHRGKGNKALPLWQEILRLEPNNGEVRFDLANYYRSRGEDERAFQELYQAFSSPNLSIDAKIMVAHSYFQITERYPELLPEAYQLLEMMVDRHPENPKGWSMYGDFLYRERRFEDAWDKFHKVTKLDSTRYLVWEQLLRCAWHANNFTSLRKDGERALEAYPAQALIYLFRGMGLLYGDQPEEALVVFGQGRFFTGFNDTLEAGMIHGMARAYELLGKPEKALEHYQKAAKKGHLGSSMVADQCRFAVTWSEKQYLNELELMIRNQFQAGDPVGNLCNIWLMVAHDPENGLRQLQSHTAQHSDNYLVMEHAAAMYSYLEREQEAEAAVEAARRLSTGNKMLR
jgi:predicted Zn-dependent protease